MKKILVYLCLAISVLTLGMNSAKAFELENKVIDQAENIQTYKTENEIRNYLNQSGKNYDSKILEIITVDSENKDGITDENTSGDIGICAIGCGAPYKTGGFTTIFTDRNNRIHDSIIPAGTFTFSTQVGLSAKVIANATLGTSELSVVLGFEVTRSYTQTVTWSNTYNKRVNIIIYPRYRAHVFTLAHKCFFIEYSLGVAEAWDPIGYEIEVREL